MKKIFAPILFCLLLCSAIANAQFESVDSKVGSYPRTFSDPQRLADMINRDFTSDTDKARAIYTWLGTNVRYDLHAFNTNTGVAFSYTTPEDKINKEREFRLKLTRSALRSGKAICEGYASAFTYLCAKIGLQAAIIPGTSKTSHNEIGRLPTASDHVWNAVKLDGQWKLIDATWAAGVVSGEKFAATFNDVYFCTEPGRFFLNHFPDDPKWLLTDRSAEDFAELPFYYPTYLKSDYELNADKGMIRFPQDVAVRFNIRNLKETDKLYYITSRNNVLDEIEVDERNNFIIYPSAKLSGYLTIFINEKPLVSYKIIRG
jgi:transglutaminase/protease-like cytokinesis protein 3